MGKLRGRRTMVTDEPMRVAPELMGHPLGSVRRRFAALIVDLVLFITVAGALMFGLMLLNLYVSDSSFVPDVIAAGKLPDGAEKSDTQFENFRRFLIMSVDRDHMRADEAEILDVILSGDKQTFKERFGELRTSVELNEDKTRLIRDDSSVTMVIGTDTLFGRAGGYSASTATALLGFLEASWHPNRQALHDKISGTVVLRTRRLPTADPS